jgi:general secretion pathway protein A
MYEKSFGLEKCPFNMTPDPAFLFFTSHHREAVAGLAYAIMNRKGFVVLTGEAGTGKTTVLSKVLHLFPERIHSSVIFNPTVTADEFLEMAMLDFGMPDVPVSKAQRITKLQHFLLEARKAGKLTALVVDEAHKLSTEVLEEIRLLGNFERADEKLLQILLIGQPELSELLEREDLRQFKQRIALRLSIMPLSADEVEKYLAHRWSTAGGQAPQPFSPAAVARIVMISRGIPRVINAICDNALMLGFCDATRNITVDHVLAAARDLCLIDGASPKPTGKPTKKQFQPEEKPTALLPIDSPRLGLLDCADASMPRRSLLSRWTARLGFTN